jgi:hypothetical protein
MRTFTRFNALQNMNQNFHFPDIRDVALWIFIMRPLDVAVSRSHTQHIVIHATV